MGESSSKTRFLIEASPFRCIRIIGAPFADDAVIEDGFFESLAGRRVDVDASELDRFARQAGRRFVVPEGFLDVVRASGAESVVLDRGRRLYAVSGDFVVNERNEAELVADSVEVPSYPVSFEELSLAEAIGRRKGVLY